MFILYTASDIGTAFLSSIPVDAAATLLDAKRGKVMHRLEEVRDALERVDAVESAHLPLLHARLRLEADLAWLDEVARFAGGAPSLR